MHYTNTAAAAQLGLALSTFARYLAAYRQAQPATTADHLPHPSPLHSQEVIEVIRQAAQRCRANLRLIRTEAITQVLSGQPRSNTPAEDLAALRASVARLEAKLDTLITSLRPR